MLTVAYDHHAFALQHVGGVTRYFYELATRLNGCEGLRATVIAPVHFNSYLRAGGARVYGHYIPPIPRTGRLIRGFNNGVSPLLLRLLRPDIVHETYYRGSRSVSREIPVVVTVYDMIHEKLPRAFRIDDKVSEDKRAAVRNADHVICISHNTQRDLVDVFNVPVSKTSVIHLGANFTTHSHTIAANSGTNLGELKQPFLLYVGRRDHWKNFPKLLAAYAASSILRRNFSLVAFGGGPFSGEELNDIQRFGLKLNNVRQLSGDDSLLGSLYKAATLFVYPSLYEGFGIPPLEAMSFGCPVACSNTSSLPEVVGDAAELFDPSDVDSIKQAVELIIESNARKSELIMKGEQRIKLFSWDKCASDTTAVYRRLVN